MIKFSERDMDNLAAILDYCDRIDDIVERFGNTIEQFSGDADFRDAAMMNIFQIGEASNRLSEECKEEIDSVPWQEIYGTRNVIAHGYVTVNDEIIWNIIVNDIPALRRAINEQAGII